MISNKLYKDLEKEIYKKSYYEFFKVAFCLLHPGLDYDENWHAKYLCDELQAEFERINNKIVREKDLIINMPFRAAKSMITTIIFPIWCWSQNPRFKFITVSYSADLALEHAGRSRDLMLSDWFQGLYGDSVTLKPDTNAKGHYETTQGGMRKAVGTGGQITGSGADIIILDDPINAKKAASEVERKGAIDFYNHTLFSRLNQPDLGIRIIVMQRLHMDDISGHLIKERPDDHKIICIPAEISDNLNPPELAKYYVDGLFWPSRFNRRELKNYKKALGGLQYAGQLGQKPTPDEGGIIKRDWLEIVEATSLSRSLGSEPIHFFVDSAYTQKQENDPSGLLACYKKDNCLYIINADEVWMEFPELCAFIKKYASGNGYTQNSKIFVEPKASGLSIVQQLRANTSLNIITAKSPKDDKLTRLHSVAPIIEAKRIKIIKGSWNTDFIDQVTNQPNSKHWDMTDCMVMAIDELLINSGFDWLMV